MINIFWKNDNKWLIFPCYDYNVFFVNIGYRKLKDLNIKLYRMHNCWSTTVRQNCNMNRQYFYIRA